MKRIILIVVVILLTWKITMAQHRVFAPEVGLNISRMILKGNNELLEEFKSKLGLRFGCTIDGRLTPSFSFQTGLFYSRMGCKYVTQDPYNGIDRKGDVRLNYLQVPATFVFHIQPAELKGKIIFGFGLYLGVLLSASEKQQSSVLQYTIGNGDQCDIKPVDAGFNFKLGYRLPSGLFFKLDIIKGFNNILPGGSSSLKWQNQGLAFSIGYFLEGRPKTKKSESNQKK